MNRYVLRRSTVAQEANRQSLQAIRRAIRINPDATKVITDCYAEIEPDSCAEIPSVDLLRHHLTELVLSATLTWRNAPERFNVRVGRDFLLADKMRGLMTPLAA